MALRLRRGTDAQRQLITPAQGELIYVTDTTELYVGDGTTLGGVRITGEVVNQLSQLNDVDAALPQDGDVLSYDSATGDWVAGELPLGDLSNVDLVTVPPTDGSVLSYDTATGGWIAGSALGLDATIGGLTNVAVAADTASHQDFLLYNYDNAQWQSTDITNYDFKINIIGNDSTILVNTDTNTFNGNVDGNVYSGATLVLDATAREYNGNVNGNVIGSHTGPVIGDVTGSVFADNSTLLVDGVAGKFYGELNGTSIGTHNGPVVGRVVGDVEGSVFADDSSLLVDGVNGEIVGNVNALIVDGNTVIGGDLRIGGNAQNAISTIDPATTTMLLNTTNSAGEVVMGKPLRIGGTSSGFDNYGFLNIFNEIQNTNALTITHNSESANSVTATIAKSRGTKLAPTVVTSGDTLGAFQAQGYNGSAYRNAGGMAVIANGTPGAAYVPAKVSLYTAASNGIPTPQFTVDGNGTGTFTGAAQLAVYADNTARDAAITSPTAGMLVFNTTNTKFQGYTGSAWVDLN